MAELLSVPRSLRRGLDAAAFLAIYALGVPLSPQFELFGIPDVRPTDLLLVIAVIAFTAEITTNKDWRGLWKAPPLFGPLLAVLCWDFARMFIAPNYEIGSHTMVLGVWYGLKRLEYCVIFLIAYSACLKPGAASRSIRALLLGSVGFNLLIVYQYHAHAGELGFRASGFGADQPNQAALFIIGVCSLAAAWLQNAAERSYRLVCLAVLASGAVALLATGSKEGLLGAAIAGVVLALRRQRWGLVVAVALVGVCVWPFFPDDVRDRYTGIVLETQRTWESIDRPEAQDLGGSSLADRVVSAQYVVMYELPNCFWTGNGLGSKHLGAVDDFYLFECVSNGFIGLSLFMWFLWRAWQGILRAQLLKDEVLVTITQALDCYFIVCVVNGFASETYYLVRPMELFFLLLGLVCGRAAYCSLKTRERILLEASPRKVAAATLAVR